jgi:hypothetical protein
MTYEEFRDAVDKIAGEKCTLFISDRRYRDNLSQKQFELTAELIWDEDKNDPTDRGILRTKYYTGERRYKNCLMDLKLQIFNKKKEAANTGAWREENEA